MELKPGSNALVVKSPLVTRNLGREVVVINCLGQYEKGDRIDLGGRYLTANRGGLWWQIRGLREPLQAMLSSTGQVVETWELVAHSDSLMPLNDSGLPINLSRDSELRRGEQ